MSKKSILSEAIAEARQIRETALENAKKQLEESLTPGIKEMLAHKLNEELELEEEDLEEETLEEAADPSGFKPVKVKAKKPVNEADEDPETEEDPAEDPETEEDAEDPAEDPETEEDAEDPAEDPEADEDPVEDPEADEDPAEDPETEEDPIEDPEAEEDEISDDTPLSDIKVSDLKNIIADMIAAGTPTTEPAPGGNQGVDTDAADVDIQGTGEEEAPVSGGPQPTDMPAEDPTIQGMTTDQPEKEEESDEEIDLTELLRELEEEAGFEANDQRGKVHDKNNSLEGQHQDSELEDGSGIQENKKAKHGPNCTCDACKQVKAEKDLKKAKKELAEALKTVKELKETLSEVNLVNSKLVYMTRTLNNNTLSESQKSTVIHTFDKAESVKEVKELYKMLQESFGSSKTPARSRRRMLAEHRGSASRVVGGAPKAVEVDATVRRFQQLAGIITED